MITVTYFRLLAEGQKFYIFIPGVIEDGNIEFIKIPKYVENDTMFNAKCLYSGYFYYIEDFQKVIYFNRED